MFQNICDKISLARESAGAYYYSVIQSEFFRTYSYNQSYSISGDSDDRHLKQAMEEFVDVMKRYMKAYGPSRFYLCESLEKGKHSCEDCVEGCRCGDKCICGPGCFCDPSSLRHNDNVKFQLHPIIQYMDTPFYSIRQAYYFLADLLLSDFPTEEDGLQRVMHCLHPILTVDGFAKVTMLDDIGTAPPDVLSLILSKLPNEKNVDLLFFLAECIQKGGFPRSWTLRVASAWYNKLIMKTPITRSNKISSSSNGGCCISDMPTIDTQEKTITTDDRPKWMGGLIGSTDKLYRDRAIHVLEQIKNVLIVWNEDEVNQYKIAAYDKAIANIESYPDDLPHTKAALKKIPGIGVKIADKIVEVWNTGTYHSLEKGKLVDLTLRLLKIPGLGREWYSSYPLKWRYTYLD